MDQDKAFREYFEGKRRTTFAQMIAEAGEERAEALMREAWYGSLNAQPKVDFDEALAERDWARGVIAQEMGVDAPLCEAGHPLRDWLQELGALRQAHDGGKVVGLLALLRGHGGPYASLADAAMLFARKGEDYNTGFKRDDYFPLGLSSYAQMLWVKALRLVSFAKQPRKENFEGVQDTLLDLINYAAFARDHLGRLRDGKEAPRG